MSSSMCKDIPERLVLLNQKQDEAVVSYLHLLAMLVLGKCAVSLLLEKYLEVQFHLYYTLTESNGLARKR